MAIVETREKILDTIEVCQTYVDDYAAHKAAGRPDDCIFNPNYEKFAHTQIAFERSTEPAP